LEEQKMSKEDEIEFRKMRIRIEKEEYDRQREKFDDVEMK